MAVNELEELQTTGRPTAGVNQYSDMIAQDRGVQKQTLQGSMFAATKTQPDRQAQVMELSQKTNLPTSIVERNFDDIQKKRAANAFDYDNMIKETPGLAKYMEDPNNAALSRNETDQLGKIDKSAQMIAKGRPDSNIYTLPTELTHAATTGWRGLESASWHLAAAYGLSTPEDAAAKVAEANKRSNDLRAMMPDYSKEFSDTMAKQSGDVNKAFHQFTGSWKEMRDGQILKALQDFGAGGVHTVGEAVDMVGAAAARPRGLMYSTVENLANSFPSLVAGLGMAKLGAAAGTLTGPAAPIAVPVLGMTGMAVGTFAGSVTTEVGSWINEEMGRRGIDTTDKDAILAAYRDPKLMADIRGEAERKGVTTAAVDALFSAFAGKVLASAGKEASILKKAAHGIGDIGVQAIGETTSEYAGQVAAKKGDLSKTDFGDAIQEGIISLGHSVGETAIGHSTRHAFSKNTTQAATEVADATKTALRSLEQAQSLQAIGESIKELKTTHKVPGKIEELINHTAGESSVYFQSDDWDKYWASKGKSPSKAAEQIMGDGGKAYVESKQTGKPLEIPLGKYVDKTATTEDFEGLLASAKTSADSMSANEAKEHLASLPATMQELAKEAAPTAQELDARKSAKEVGNTVAEQLKAVGVDQHQAILYEHGFRTLGERMGVDPMELFNQFKLRIGGEQVHDEGQVLNQSNLTEEEMAPHKAILDQVNTADKAVNLKGEERAQYLAALDAVYGPRQDRAQKMGFGPDTVYHGSPSSEVDKFNLGSPKSGELYGRGVYTTGDHEEANIYSDILDEHSGVPLEEQSGPVYPLKKRDGKVFDVRKEFDAKVAKKVIAELPADRRKTGRSIEDNYNLLELARDAGVEPKKISDILKGEGYDSVKTGMGFDVSLDPSDIRSTNAAFDPRFADSSLILAQQGEGGPRGQIHIGAQGMNISILKGADFSTFLHETGHFYLEVMQDLAARETAPEQIKQDFQTIRDWLGAKEGEKLTVDQHEQFARGFEGYLMDGKAPSSSLAKAFARFKVWLISVYQKLRPTAELTPQVRDVMNRMLATDEEISQAEQKFQPLFDDPKAMGMNEKQAEKYIEARQEARIAAEEEMMAKLMADHAREQGAIWKERRLGVKAEVEAQVNNTNLYKALALLQKGTMPDGSPLAEGVKPFKLSREALVAEYGSDLLKRMPKPYVYTKEDGIHPDVAATLLGFENGDALVTQLANSVPRKDIIDKITDQKMNQMFPDLLTDGAIESKAMDMIHNEKRSKLLQLELQHLVNNNLPVAKDVIRRTVRRMMPIEQVRAEATRIVESTKTNALSPYQYQRAEIKSAKEAGIALAKGDIDAAFAAKQRELLNHELYRASVTAKEFVEKSLVDFRKFGQSDEKIAKGRDMDLVNTGRAILSAFGLGAKGADEFTAQAILSKMQQYDPENYAVARSLYDSAVENGAGPYSNIPYNDFVAMQQSVSALWDLAKSTKQIEIEGMKRDLEEVKTELISQAVKFQDPSAKKEYTTTADAWSKTKAKLLGARADLIRIEHWAEAMDVTGNREFTNYVFRPVADAVTKYRLEKKGVIEKYKSILAGYEKNLTREKIKSDELGHIFQNKAELMMAVLHSGNESNLKKLLAGRNWGSVDSEGKLDSSKWKAFTERMQKEGVLTKADYDFAQQIWDLLESMKAGAQKAHKQMYGYYFKEITADGVQTPFGEYRGGYIPAKLDVNDSEDASIRQERESFEKNNNSYQYPTTGRGFTKSRVETYAGPLSLDMNLLGGHIDGVLRFTNIEPRVKEVSRIVMDKEFRAALRTVDPAVAKDALVPWLQRAAQQQVVTPSRDGLGKLTDAIASKLRSAVAVQIMFGNVTNTLQQLTGVFVAATKIPLPHLRNALVSYIADMKGTSEAIMERSDWMRSTQGSNVFETAQAINNIIVQPTAFESMQQFAKKHTYFLQSATQNFVNNVVWQAGYNHSIESGMTESQAAKEADSKVRMTQGTVNPEDVSRFETGTQTERLFKQFVGYFNMLANLNGFELQKIARETGLKKGAGRAFYVYSMGIMIPAVLSEVLVRAMSGKNWDEDDDGYLNDGLSAFFGSQFKTLMATVPYGGQLAVATYNRFNKQQWDDRLSLSPVLSVLEGVAGVPVELYKNIAEDVDNKKRLTKDVMTLLGVLSSLPIGPVGKPVGYMMDVKDGKAQPSGPVDFARGLITGKSGQQQ